MYATVASLSKEPTMTDIASKTTEPVGGAGVFDVDPPQDGVSQDRTAVVVSDINALPEDMEF
jgi:hypothetical protein